MAGVHEEVEAGNGKCYISIGGRGWTWFGSTAQPARCTPAVPRSACWMASIEGISGDGEDEGEYIQHGYINQVHLLIVGQRCFRFVSHCGVHSN